MSDDTREKREEHLKAYLAFRKSRGEPDDVMTILLEALTAVDDAKYMLKDSGHYGEWWEKHEGAIWAAHSAHNWDGFEEGMGR